MQNPSAATIVLASSSVYRQHLLDRFLDNYETVSPGVDESADIDEPEELELAGKGDQTATGEAST